MPTDQSLDLAAALANHKLTPYRGRDVVRTSIKITNAGDGLSSAMRIDPVEYDPETTVYVVLECTVAKHAHMPIPDTGTYELEQSFRAGAATIVDADLVRAHIEQQQARIQAAKDNAIGKVNLEGEPGWLSDSTGTPPTEEGDEDDEQVVMRRHHMAGRHADELMDGCPICGEERAAVEAEQS